MKFYFLLLICATGCNSNNSTNLDTDFFLNEFARVESKEIPIPNPYLFFLKTNKGKVVKMHNFELYNVYEHQHSLDVSFRAYISLLYTDRLTLSDSTCKNSNASNYLYSIESLSIETILTDNCERKKDSFVLKNDIDQTKKMSILYRLFKCGYGIMFDDYLGYYIIEPMGKKKALGLSPR